MNFKEEQQKKVTQIEEILVKYLPEQEGYQKLIMDAMEYAVMAGGKRLRPMLMMETYHLFGGKGDLVEPFMAAIEMIHTYSLVHDDLPAMDNDDYRRGRKTTHVVYGEAMGILAGDALLNFSFETACKAFTNGEDAKWDIRVAKALQIFGQKAGIFGMIGGQVVDVEKTGQPLTEDEITFIYELKTCALLEASMMIGAVLGGATEEELALVERMAKNIGMAFQIQDDILDLTGDEAKLGKPIGSDEKNEKTTYVTLHGLESSSEEVKKLSAEAVELAKKINGTPFLQELITYLTVREN